MSASQAGYLDYGFLGAAQIDCYGNLNTTVIGDWQSPTVRFPGSGGANDVGSLCWRTIIVMRQDERRFVKELDFLTTPGYLDGPGAREQSGLPSRTGPYRVITQLGLYDFDEESKRMRLLATHPGVDLDEVQAKTSFDLIIPDQVETTDPPPPEALAVMREIDPTGMVIGK